MRILIIGFLVLAAWMTFSTYIYVCKIKGLCQEPVTHETVAVPAGEEETTDTIAEPLVVERAAVPADAVIYFAFDKSEFSPDPQLEKYLLDSKAYLDQNMQAKLKFTGHTCSIGTDEYNQALGLRRAQSAKQYFENQGLSVTNCIVESKGEKEPWADNQTESGRSKNRRTLISIIE